MKIPTPKNLNNWLSLGNSTFGKGLSFFHCICRSAPWLELLFFLSTLVLNADALSANGRRLFSSLFYLFLELSALFAILLLDGIAPNLTDLLKIIAIMIAAGNISYFLKLDYKNDVGLYFLRGFSVLFRLHPISGVGISISVPSLSPPLI